VTRGSMKRSGNAYAKRGGIGRALGRWAILSALVLAVASCGPQKGAAPANDVAEFYRDKTITIIVGSTSGGGYDSTARLLSRHLGRFIPGTPRIIVQNMPGGGSLLAANHVNNIAPKDGTVIGLSFDSAILAPLWQFKGAQFDPQKMHYLGSLTQRDKSVVIVRHDSPVKTLEEARTRVATLGSGGASSSTSAYAMLVNEMLGTKFKIVTGYPGNREVMLALERGEVDGRAATSVDGLEKEYPGWFAKGFVIPLILLSLEPIPELSHVPHAISLARNEDDRKIMRVALGLQRFGRIFYLAGDIPPERAKALQEGFQAMIADPSFAREGARVLDLPLDPSPPQRIQAYLQEAYALPEPLKERTARYIGGE